MPNYEEIWQYYETSILFCQVHHTGYYSHSNLFVRYIFAGLISLLAASDKILLERITYLLSRSSGEKLFCIVVLEKYAGVLVIVISLIYYQCFFRF